MKDSMLQAVEKLSNVCELILMTVLPGDTVSQFLTSMPAMRGFFSHIICREELPEVGNIIVKDISLLTSHKQRDVS
jgi:hypothetical protein